MHKGKQCYLNAPPKKSRMEKKKPAKGYTAKKK
jgi:hypothetical protein